MRRFAPMAQVAGLVVIAGCGGQGPAAADAAAVDAPASPTLEILPADAELVVEKGQEAEQAYTAIAHLPDGTTRDVTVQTVFSVDERFGYFSAIKLIADGGGAGVATVTGTWNGVVGEARAIIKVKDERIDGAAPQSAPDLFAAAAQAPGLAAAITYPAGGAVLPPNLARLDVGWDQPGAADLFELAFVSPFLEYRLYLSRPAAATQVAELLADDWALVASARRGGVKVAVRSMVA